MFLLQEPLERLLKLPNPFRRPPVAKHSTGGVELRRFKRRQPIDGVKCCGKPVAIAGTQAVRQHIQITSRSGSTPDLPQALVQPPHATLRKERVEDTHRRSRATCGHTQLMHDEPEDAKQKARSRRSGPGCE